MSLSDEVSILSELPANKGFIKEVFVEEYSDSDDSSVPRYLPIEY